MFAKTLQTNHFVNQAEQLAFLAIQTSNLSVNSFLPLHKTTDVSTEGSIGPDWGKHGYESIQRN